MPGPKSPKQVSTASSIMSRMSEPLTPAFATAPGDDLAVMGVENERAADDVAVPAGELETVGAPAQIGTHHHSLAVMAAAGALTAIWPPPGLPA